MRTNIVLNDELIEEGFELTDVKTKRDLVELALCELVQRRRRLRLLTLKGIGWEGDLKEMRKSRFGEDIDIG